MKAKAIVFVFFLFFSSFCFSEDFSEINYIPPNGIVPDGETAILIARPILEKIYGRSKIHEEEPLRASPANPQTWVVQGTFNHPPGSFGGVAMILIRRRDGAVLGVIHER